MQIRSFRGSGEPAWVNAPSSARFCLGPDPRRALGPAATPAALTGRTRDRTRPMLQNVRKFLPGRRPHVTQSGSHSWKLAVTATEQIKTSAVVGQFKDASRGLWSDLQPPSR